MMHWFLWFLDLFFLPLWPLAYVLARFQAKPCPACGEKWYTELTGEWDGEDWRCWRCGHRWNLPYT